MDSGATFFAIFASSVVVVVDGVSELTGLASREVSWGEGLFEEEWIRLLGSLASKANLVVEKGRAMRPHVGCLTIFKEDGTAIGLPNNGTCTIVLKAKIFVYC